MQLNSCIIVFGVFVGMLAVCARMLWRLPGVRPCCTASVSTKTAQARKKQTAQRSVRCIS